MRKDSHNEEGLSYGKFCRIQVLDLGNAVLHGKRHGARMFREDKKYKSRRRQEMNEKERVKEMRRRKLKRAAILGLIVLFFIRRSKKRREKRNAEAE